MKLFFINLNNHPLINDVKFIIPEVFLLVSLLFIFIIIIYFSNILIYKYIKIVLPTIHLIILIIIIYIILNFNNIDNIYIISYYLLYNDKLIFFYKILISIIMILIFFTSYIYMKINNILIFEFYILISLSYIGLLLLIMSFDFIMAYLSIEFQSLCFYIITAINKNKNSSIEAGLKYFILGSFSSSLLILGIAIIYGVTGFTNFNDLALLLNINFNYPYLDNYLFIGFLFINIGLFFKLSIPPFHIWLPDIYEGSLKVVLFIFALLGKLSIIIFFWKIYSIILIKTLFDWQNLLLLFILLSWLIGVLGGLTAKKFSRLIAYSSINHMGFILLILILNNKILLTLYLIIYILTLSTLLLIWLNTIKWNNYKGITTIYQFIYIIKSNNLLFLCIILMLFSLAGIPPLSGFFGKFYVLFFSLEYNYYLLVMIGLFFSIVSCFYYLRLIKIISFNNTNSWFFLLPLKRSYSYIVIIFTIINVIFIILLPFIVEYLNYLMY